MLPLLLFLDERNLFREREAIDHHYKDPYYFFHKVDHQSPDDEYIQSGREFDACVLVLV